MTRASWWIVSPVAPAWNHGSLGSNTVTGRYPPRWSICPPDNLYVNREPASAHTAQGLWEDVSRGICSILNPLGHCDICLSWACLLKYLVPVKSTVIWEDAFARPYLSRVGPHRPQRHRIGFSWLCTQTDDGTVLCGHNRYIVHWRNKLHRLIWLQCIMREKNIWFDIIRL